MGHPLACLGQVMDKELRTRLENAAKRVCDEAKSVAATFSRRIPAATSVQSNSRQVSVVTDVTLAPNAPAFEYGERHPLFGNRDHWYKQPTRAYMTIAVSRKANAAMDEIANVVDDYAKKEGFT